MGLSVPVPLEIGGYVLAGGRSSRMGQDKALLELGGKPLIRHAVKKLRRVAMDVRILGADERLAEFAPLVPDLHPGNGPLGGLEAALAHSIFDWNLILPVDMPFLPTAFLLHWAGRTVRSSGRGARIAMFTVDGVPHPAFCLLHREVQPLVVEALERGERKLYPVLENAGRELATRQGILLGRCFENVPWTGEARFAAKPNLWGPEQEPWCFVSEAQQAARELWFLNLNTPEEFAEAELHLDALDT